MGTVQAVLSYVQSNGINLLEWLAIYIVIFIPLALCFPGKPSQPLLRKDMGTDLAFFFATPLYGSIQTLLMVFFFTSLCSITAYGILTAEGKPYLSTLPLAVQVVMAVVLTDFLQYWTHRVSHKGYLWKLHCIHHSSKNVDWLSSARWHPVNFLYHITLTQAVVWSFGYSVEAFPLVMAVNGLNGALVHANLNWTYGPLRYVVASPVFHRWHHTSPEEGGDKNFAPFFSLFDVMFGTFYMPKGSVPSEFGAPYETVPEICLGKSPIPSVNPRVRPGAVRDR